MDFEGITWAGNIYQKFETMCLEVEEVMYQDTVKYMENQVQKVSGSVKKFYSDVMQDLLPPSCVQSMKVASSEDFCSFPHNAHTDTDKKPASIITDTRCDLLKKKEDETEFTFEVKEEKESPKNVSYSIKSLPRTSAGVSDQDKLPESCFARNKKAGAHKPLVGIKRISQNNQVSKDSCSVTSLSGDKSNQKLRNSSAEKTSDDALVLSSDSIVRLHDHEKPVKGNISTSETPCKTPSPDEVLSAESLMQQKDNSKCMSSVSENNTSVSKPGSYVISDSWYAYSDNNGAVTTNEDPIDKFDLELIENEQVMDPREEETSEPIETSKLEESCVLIEGNALIQYIPEGTTKHKKKIHKTILSKLQSTKKQKHQFVYEIKDIGGKKSEKRKLSAEDTILESDWELL